MEGSRRPTEHTVRSKHFSVDADKFCSDKWVQTNGQEELLLPGLNYTQRQMFWLSGANVWCSKVAVFIIDPLKVCSIIFFKARPQALKLSVLTGAHSPDKFRVQGTFSNMAAFSRDWGCPVGSNMNPPKEDKCKVW